jgi:hypothetical protein
MATLDNPGFAIPHLTMFFDGYGKSWSESYYLRTPTRPADMVAATLVMRSFRQLMLARGYVCTAARMSDDGVDGDSALAPPFKLSDVGDVYNPSLLLKDPAIPGSTVAFRLETDTMHRRIMKIGGVPNDVVSEFFDPTFARCPEWAIAAANWIANLKQDYAIKTRQKVPQGTPSNLISKIASDATGVITITCQNPIPAGNNLVVVSRAKFAPDSPRVAGIYRINPPTGLNVTLANAFGTVEYLKGGTIRPYVIELKNITDVVPRGIGEKKRGRTPYSKARGRYKSLNIVR